MAPDFEARRAPGTLPIRWSPATISSQDSQDFPAGVLHLASKPTLGVIRIGLFSEYAHPALCQAAQHALALPDDAPCDDTCQDQFQIKVADLLTAALERRVQLLAKAGAERLLIDITGNGGGTNWVEPAARVLSSIQLQSPRCAFVKHEHWEKELRHRLTEVKGDLAGAVPPHRSLLENAVSTLRRGIENASKPCSLTVYWTQQDMKADCSNLETNLLYVSGILPYARPGISPA